MTRVILVLGLGLVVIAGAAGDEKTDELKKFQGQWRILRMDGGERDDTTVPQKELEKMSIEIKGNTLIMHNSGKKEQLTFIIDPTKKPKTIDWTITVKSKKKGENKVLEKKATMLGIYSLEGNQLKLCLSDPGDEKPERPKKFRAAEGSLLMILEKKK